ncbi:MAG: hypothetical protein RSA12_02650 [Clostridia bacterium]
MNFDIDALLRQYVTHGIVGNPHRHVGLELEYPLIPLKGDAVDLDVLRGLFPVLAGIGFDQQRFSSSGLPLRATDADGNTVTFDTCYGVLEYVTTHVPSMQPLYRRYREAIALIQRYLTDNGHMLIGMGINPYASRMKQTMLESELTMVIGEFFKYEASIAMSPRAKYLDFYCDIASEQVHFNTTPEELPALFCAFTYVDFANILLFSNSPAQLDGAQYRCGRIKLYTDSIFNDMGVVGSQMRDPQTLDDIVRSYRKLCLFTRHRDGRAEIFPPTPIEDYFTDPQCAARPEDIFDFDLERNIVTTSYGTVEYRLNCTQPFSNAFVPSAFNLGLRTLLGETLELSRKLYGDLDLKDPNQVNDCAARGFVEGLSPERRERHLRALLDIAQRGLKARGYGEEAFLLPLLKRPAIDHSPAEGFLHDARTLGLDQAILLRGALGDSLID